MLDIKLQCGNCAWYGEITIPEEKKDEISPRGYCTFEPPQVFPVPKQQQSTLALAQGQTAPGQVTMMPYMMRPVVEEEEVHCGRYQPNKEVSEKFAAYKESQCGGNCEDCDGCEEGDCNCGS